MQDARYKQQDNFAALAKALGAVTKRKPVAIFEASGTHFEVGLAIGKQAKNIILASIAQDDELKGVLVVWCCVYCACVC